MKFFGHAILISSFLTLPVHATEKRIHKNIMKSFLIEVQRKYQPIFEKIPKKVLTDVSLEKKKFLQKEISEKIKKVETLDPDEIEKLRKEMLTANQKEGQLFKKEIAFHLDRLSVHSLDRISESIEHNPAYQDELAEYQFAFTESEKKKVLGKVMFKELDRINSQVTKRSHSMNAQDYRRELLQVQNMMVNKGYNDDQWGTILIVAGAVLATTALVTWGVASIVYGGRYRQSKSQRESDLEQLKTDLENKYWKLNSELDYAELTYLQENGYVRTVCGNYIEYDSISCSGLGYRVYSGETFCTVYCYKNLNSGKEARHEIPSCSSPWVPTGCDRDQEEYDAGHDHGYDYGYEDGYDDGFYAGEDDGRYYGDREGSSDGYYDGLSAGESDGWSIGYDDGYSAGYSSYFALGGMDLSSESFASSLEGKDDRYIDGYLSGLLDAEFSLNMVATI